MADAERAGQRITNRGRVLVLSVVAVAGVVADLGSKSWAFSDARFADFRQEWPVLGSWLVIQRAYNPGAVWGIFGAHTDLLTVASALAVPLLVWLALREARATMDFLVAIGLVLGGAIGNLYDRVALGQVRDFIGVWLGSYRWPTFNIADSGISVGVAWLLVRELFAPKAPASGDPSE